MTGIPGRDSLNLSAPPRAFGMLWGFFVDGLQMNECKQCGRETSSSAGFCSKLCNESHRAESLRRIAVALEGLADTETLVRAVLNAPFPLPPSPEPVE